MADVSLRGVAKRFGAATALSGIDLAIPDGAFVAILGPSGCGKTTLLRLLAGFETPDEGTVAIGGEAVAGPGWATPPEARRLGMVFQSYALWPHMSVAGNVGYALRVAGRPRAAREAKVAEALAAVDLVGMGERRPEALSGGQRQRVALARCLAQDPRLVLLDEPLANLDAHLRDQMQAEFAAFHARTRATMVYVTHDQGEALALADLVAVLDRGRVQQVASPRALYAEPATEMVAAFIGRGVVVPVEGIARDREGGLSGTLWGHRLDLAGEAAGRRAGRACLRAEAVSFAPPGADGIAARIVRQVFQGERTVTELAPLAAPETRLRSHAPAPPAGPEGLVALRIGRSWLLPPEPSGTHRAGPGGVR